MSGARFDGRWLPAAGLVLLLLNLAAWGFYRVALADEADLGKSRISRGEDRLAALRAENERIAEYLARAEGNESGLGEFYGLRLAREEQALTKTIAEIKELSRRAGLDPAQISYEKEPFEDEGLLRWSLVFGVDGTYQELRQLINFLELTDSFLILERVELRGDDDGSPNLQIDLGIATLFSTSQAVQSSLASEEAAG